MAETKGASVLKSSEMQRPDSLGTSEIREGAVSQQQTNGAGSKTSSSGSQGYTNAAPKPNSNQILGITSVNKQNTENFARQQNNSNGFQLSHQTSSGTTGTKAKGQGAPQISKVNITFGSQGAQAAQA